MQVHKTKFLVGSFSRNFEIADMQAEPTNATPYRWSFASVGGVKRVNLDKGEDLLHLHELDQKLWTVLSCPVNGLEIDTRSLQLMDMDGDGKLRVNDVLAAVAWATRLLRNPDDLLKQAEQLPLDAINTDDELGKKLHASAKTILKSLGLREQSWLSTAETSDATRIFENTKFNGDGIITPASAGDDAELAALIATILEASQGLTDRSGKVGIDRAAVASFYELLEQRLNWLQAGTEKQVKPLDDQTAAAWEALQAVETKVDDYFLRCRLAAFDAQTVDSLGLAASSLESYRQSLLDTGAEVLHKAPLAKIEAGAALPLISGINPAWEKAIQNLHQRTVEPLLGKQTSLSQAQWEQLKAQLAAYGVWLAAEIGQALAPWSKEQLQQLQQSNRAALEALIDKDEAQCEAAENIMQVDKLVRFHRDLYRLLKNFVTFYDFYSNEEERAIFEAGTLYIDQRSLSLCIRVDDMGRHNQLAGMSGMYLLYCQCKSRHSNESMTIVAALTDGDVDNLVIGRNALFYDMHGRDWDATIVKIIENPISIRQAFWAPYRKVAALIEKQISQFAEAQDKKVEADAAAAVDGSPLSNKPAEETKAPPVPFDIGKFVGIFAAISLALGALGTALASVVGGFLGLVWWKMPLAIVGLLLVVSGPSMILAWLKLRNRNLAPLLDANGWAINARAAVNIAFGKTLTQLAEIPAGASINLVDPFVAKKKPYLKYLLLGGLVLGMLLYLLWRRQFIGW